MTTLSLQIQTTLKNTRENIINLTYFLSGVRQPSLYPPEPELRATVDRILFFDIGTLYKALVDYFVSSIDTLPLAIR
jgi:hypothetical protein